MKCPLLCIGAFPASSIRGNPNFDCLKEECAWWDIASHCCIPVRLERVLYDIALEVLEIKNKMPSPEFFKK